jgi:hypothetical protein
MIFYIQRHFILLFNREFQQNYTIFKTESDLDIFSYIFILVIVTLKMAT